MGTAIVIKDVSFESFGIGTVTPSSVIPIQSINIDGYRTVIGEQSYYKASFYPANTTQKSVKWGILQGNNYATIDSSTGRLTILSTANASSVVIQATSVENPSVSATLVLTLTYHKGVYGENLTQGLTWTNGYFAKDYSKKNSNVTSYSNPVQVFQNDILLCKVCGRGMRPIIECNSDLSGKKYGIFIPAWDDISPDTLYNYAYHVSQDGYVSFSSKQNDDVALWRAEKIHGITPTWIDGYIDLDGVVRSSSVTKHSSPIFVSANSIIVVKTAGTGFSVVSLTNSGGLNFIPILRQTGGEVKKTGDFTIPIDTPMAQPKTPRVETEGTWYQGVANPTNTPMQYAVYIEEDCYVSVCTKTSLPYEISIYKTGAL